MMSQASTEAPARELRALRERVMGITESVISTGDGLLVAADADTVHPESLAALSAACLGLGTRTAAEAGLGGLRHVITRCAGGYIVVLAVGANALLAILADEGLDVATLLRESPATVERLDSLLT